MNFEQRKNLAYLIISSQTLFYSTKEGGLLSFFIWGCFTFWFGYRFIFNSDSDCEIHAQNITSQRAAGNPKPYQAGAEWQRNCPQNGCEPPNSP